MSESPFNVLSDEEKGQLEESDFPPWREPMLATLEHDPFSDPEWIYERKLDGERCLAYVNGDEVELWSRNEESLNASYPEAVEWLAGAGVESAVVDGEVVAFTGGVSSFSRLQNRMHVSSAQEARATGITIFFYLFDILYLNGRDTRRLPLRARKKVLKRAFAYEEPLRYTPHRNEDGLDFYRKACEQGWEGLIAKKAVAPYVHTRSRRWRKFKCVQQQEFVIGGYTDPAGERIGFGALLLGYYDDDRLRYAGMVGTGFDDATLRRLHDRLTELEQSDSPFVSDEMGGDDVHWVDPKLVGEVKFTEWTDDLRLRHPAFLGVRRDKAPREVTREA